MNLEAYLEERRRRIEQTLARLLPPETGPTATVARAMRYAVLGGGKRLRPILALAAHEACGGACESFAEPAAALELIHTYSLIHDDLPAMDDDDLRRGRPTLHRAFGEAQAILAGDALLTLAFEILAGRPSESANLDRRVASVLVVARSVGIGGMVGGQVADLEAEHEPIDAERLRWIHEHKTGALFGASAELGAIHAGASADRRNALARFGRLLGLGFQIADDVLDCTATAEALGKTPGKDRRAGKATYPSLFGVEPSRARALDLSQTARGYLREAGLLTEPLEALTHHAVARTV